MSKIVVHIADAVKQGHFWIYSVAESPSDARLRHYTKAQHCMWPIMHYGKTIHKTIRWQMYNEKRQY